VCNRSEVRMRGDVLPYSGLGNFALER